MVLRLMENGYKLIFWRMKPSILKILIGVMQNTGAKFVHCDTEDQLEALVDGKMNGMDRLACNYFRGIYYPYFFRFGFEGSSGFGKSASTVFTSDGENGSLANLP